MRPCLVLCRHPCRTGDEYFVPSPNQPINKLINQFIVNVRFSPHCCGKGVIMPVQPLNNGMQHLPVHQLALLTYVFRDSAATIKIMSHSQRTVCRCDCATRSFHGTLVCSLSFTNSPPDMSARGQLEFFIENLKCDWAVAGVSAARSIPQISYACFSNIVADYFLSLRAVAAGNTLHTPPAAGRVVPPPDTVSMAR